MSCASADYTVWSIVEPVNVNPATTKWIVDEPVLNISSSFSSEIIATYQKTLSKSFGTITSIRDLKVSSMSKALKNNLSALSFYKETGYDYLIETEFKSVKNDLPNFQVYPDKELTDEIYIRIMVYDLNAKSLIHDKEYRFTQKFEGGNDIAFSTKTEKLYKHAIQSVVKGFGKKYNWDSK